MKSNHANKTISTLIESYKQGECQESQVLADVSEAIRLKDSDDRQIRAYIDSACIREVRAETPSQGVLRGIPIAVKDNICVKGKEATCASKILKGYVAPYHATVIEKLLTAGAMIYGRTNMDEFAFGSSCETSCYGPTRNPRDPERVPGGSSGGSAACVSDHTALAALGSDTGGSIRQPASFCGVVGMKPTYGRVSRYGLIAFASSLDQIGPLTKDVRDSALLLNVIAGHDPKDSTSANVPVPNYLDELGKSCAGLTVGIPKEYMRMGLDKDLIQMIESARNTLTGLGVKFEEVSLPHTEYSVNVYYIIAPSEASSNLARFDGVRFGWRHPKAATMMELFENTRGAAFGAEAKRRIILGTYSLSSGYYEAYYLRAMKVRTLIKRDFDEVFKKVDLLMSPTSPSAAFKLGSRLQNPIEMYLSDIFTISANLAGVPAISIPGGFTSGESLPLGLQFVGKPFSEGLLYRVAYAFEQATDFHKKLGNVISG